MAATCTYGGEPKSGTGEYVTFDDEDIALSLTVPGGPGGIVGGWLTRQAMDVPLGPVRATDF